MADGIHGIHPFPSMRRFTDLDTQGTLPKHRASVALRSPFDVADHITLRETSSLLSILKLPSGVNFSPTRARRKKSLRWHSSVVDHNETDLKNLSLSQMKYVQKMRFFNDTLNRHKANNYEKAARDIADVLTPNERDVFTESVHHSVKFFENVDIRDHSRRQNIEILDCALESVDLSNREADRYAKSLGSTSREKRLYKRGFSHHRAFKTVLKVPLPANPTDKQFALARKFHTEVAAWEAAHRSLAMHEINTPEKSIAKMQAILEEHRTELEHAAHTLYETFIPPAFHKAFRKEFARVLSSAYKRGETVTDWHKLDAIQQAFFHYDLLDRKRESNRFDQFTVACEAAHPDLKAPTEPKMQA